MALADLYGTQQSLQRAAPAGAQQVGVGAPRGVNPLVAGLPMAQHAAAAPALQQIRQLIQPAQTLQTATPTMGAAQQQVQPGSQPAPSMAAAQQANASGITPQQLAIMNATQAAMVRQQQAAALAAQKAAAARAATPQGAADNMIANRGVFGNGPTAAAPAVRPNTQMPAMAPPRGVSNLGGA